MLFNKIKSLASFAARDIEDLALGEHPTTAAMDKIRQRRDEACGQLDSLHDRAKKERNLAWLLCAGTAAASFLVPAAIAGGAALLVSLAAGAVTCYQHLKLRAAHKGLGSVKSTAQYCLNDVRVNNREYRKRAGIERLLKDMEAGKKRRQAAAAPAEGFNVAAADLDLERDVTVRRIRLKTPAPAAA